MKNLAIVFGVALAIVLGTMIYGYHGGPSATPANACRVTRTVLTLDEQSRPVAAVVYQQQDGEWVPVAKTETTYDGQTSEATTYELRNCEWTPVARTVSESACGIELAKRTYQMTPGGEWQLTYQRQSDDLALDDGLFDDVLFDAHGHVLMKATYAWDDNGKVGLEKTEYQYDGDDPTQSVSYSWNGSGWNKQQVSQIERH